MLTGQREPWDAGWLFYPTGLFLIGTVAGLAAGRRRWWWAILWAALAVAGQMIYAAAFIESGPLVVVGLGFMMILTSVVTLMGASIPALWFWGKTGKLRG